MSAQQPPGSSPAPTGASSTGRLPRPRRAPSAGASRARSLAWVALAYAVAGAVASAVGWALRAHHPLLVLAAADGAATLVVFGFSMALDNSSVYDPYWSLWPLAAVAYLLAVAPQGAPRARQVAIAGLVGLWGLRLTWNWIRGWPGLHHEDWRYTDIRARSGRAYPLASLVAIHGLPTAWVYGGLLSVWAALGAAGRPPGGVDGVATGRPPGWVDGVAAAVTLGAVVVEAIADRQLARFRASRPPRDAILDTGLWRVSRHPNYFGEVTFWWGLYLFALAAAPGRAWVIVGPLAITGLFWFISVPLIETRMLARRPAFAERQRAVSRLVPWFPKG